MPARRLFNERSISFFINRRQISLTQRGEKGLRPMVLVISNLIKMPLYRQTGDCASSVIAHSRGETRHSFALPGVMPTPPVGSHALILRVRQPGVLSGLTEHEGLGEQRNTPGTSPPGIQNAAGFSLLCSSNRPCSQPSLERNFIQTRRVSPGTIRGSGRGMAGEASH